LDAQQALTTAHSRLEELSELEDHQEAARLDLELAKAHVAEMQVDLEEAKARETDTKILSPITGVVTALQVTPGQLVSSGITNSGGESLMTICDFSRINVEADITEADIAHLTNNLSARITSAVYPTKEFEGRIIRIAPQGVRQDEIVTFKVLIEVEDEEKHLLRPGMTAAVEIVALEKADVLLVPVNAVIEPERNPRVFIRDAQGNFNQHSITIGLSDGISCEVLTGLEAQDEVMLNLSASFLNNLP
jgi:RND family efflux transporter MFP subunit